MSTKDFLMALYPEWPAGVFAEVRAFRNGTPEQSWHRSTTAIMDKGAKLKASHDVYIGVGARRGRNGTKEGVVYVAALWADLDVPLPEARKRLAEFELPPSAVVASGHGCHAYWFLREAYSIDSTEDRAHVEARLKGLTRALGGDSCWDVSRILRLPDTLNHKNGESLGVKLVLFEPERRYNLSDFDDYALDAGPEAEPVAFITDLDAEAVLLKALDADISEETRHMIEEGFKPEGCKSRSERDQSVISRLLIAGLNDNEIRALFATYSVGDRYREKGKGDRYLRLSIGRARASLAEPPDPTTGARSWETAIVWPANVAEQQPAGPITYSGPLLPASAWQPPFDAYRQAVANTTEAADEHHFGALRAVIGVYFGRRVYVHYGRPQYAGDYVLLIGPTHDKKTTAQRRAIDLLPMLVPTVGTVSGLNSAEGLIEWLAKCDMTPQELARFIDWTNGKAAEPWQPLSPEHRRGLVAIEEFATLLLKARMEGSSQLITVLTQLYDAPAIMEPPLRTRRMVAEAPMLSVLAASTSEWVIRNLRQSDVLGGFCNRFTYYTGPPKGPMPWPPAPTRKALEDVVGAIESAYQRWAPGTAFTLSAGAQAAWKNFYGAWTRQIRAEGDGPTSMVESRIPEHSVKLALLYGALANEQPIINGEQMAAAVEVAWYLRDSIRFAFGDQLDTGESLSTKMENRILALLADSGLPKRELQQKAKVKGAGAFEFNRAYDSLVKVRAIRENTESKLVELLP